MSRRTLTVLYRTEEESYDGCPLTKIEVLSDDDVQAGSEITVNAVSSDVALVPSLRLWRGTSNLGAPTMVQATSPTYTETVKLEGGHDTRLSWPVLTVDQAVIANGGLFAVDGDTITVKGQAGDGIAVLRLQGPCVRIMPPAEYYGGVTVTATRAAQYGQWKWIVPGPGIYAFFVRNNAGTILHAFTIEVEAPSEPPQTVVIQAINAVTEAPIIGATVYINGTARGETNEWGEINVGLLDPGTYSLKITHEDYLPTDEDEIENDSFVVGGGNT